MDLLHVLRFCTVASFFTHHPFPRQSASCMWPNQSIIWQPTRRSLELEDGCTTYKENITFSVRRTLLQHRRTHWHSLFLRRVSTVRSAMELKAVFDQIQAAERDGNLSPEEKRKLEEQAAEKGLQALFKASHTILPPRIPLTNATGRQVGNRICLARNLRQDLGGFFDHACKSESSRRCPSDPRGGLYVGQERGRRKKGGERIC